MLFVPIIISSYINGSLNNIAPQGEPVLRSADGIVSLSIYKGDLYIKYNVDASKDYYAELVIGLSGAMLIVNKSNGYHTKNIVEI